MSDIHLANGQIALIDVTSRELLTPHPWRVDSNGYAVCRVEGELRYMHRIVVAAGAGQFVDHKNGNRLDNRAENLRICTHAENMRNRKVSKSNKLGIKGVRFDSVKNRYRTEIKVSGRRIDLGTYRTADEAHNAYMNGAKLYHGEFANFG